MSDWSVLTVEITCAAVSDFLTQVSLMGIDLRNVQYLDDLRIRARIAGENYLKLHKLATRRGVTLEVVEKEGLIYTALNALNRPVILVGMIIWLVLIIYLPTRVLFVRVEGNLFVDSNRIVEAAERSGICFGASRRYVRSEKVKNLLLSEIDALQWAGVNTYGCVAIISVKERVIPQESVITHKVSSIIAARDGVISGLTVTKGNPVCKVGQAVRKGQVLVSGFTDCGLSVKADTAEAEIRALTNRMITSVALTTGANRAELEKIDVRYSIQIGKNVVKLYNGSGISDPGCVKIYSKKYLTLPGGFRLPLSLIQETAYLYETEEHVLSDMSEFFWMAESAEGYLQSSMVAGSILSRNTQGEFADQTFFLKGTYLCEEMIGQVRIEEIGEHDG